MGVATGGGLATYRTVLRLPGQGPLLAAALVTGAVALVAAVVAGTRTSSPGR